MKAGNFTSWIKKEKWSIVLLAAAAVIFVVAVILLNLPGEALPRGGDYVEYELGTVEEVLSDSTFEDPISDGAKRGEQTLTVKVTTGQYTGTTLLVSNFVSPLYGVPVSKGDSVSLTISTYSSGDVKATVYEFNRIPVLIGVIIVFFIIIALVGGKPGIKSIISLIFTIICLFMILLPLLFKGAPTELTVLGVCIFIAVVSFTLIGGLHKKTVCAMLGTVSGVVLAMCFGMLAQLFARVSGFRLSDVEPLLQLRQTGTPIRLAGLLTAGIIISALGAVMDVAMSISSSLGEVHAANSSYTFKDLFRSGMNIGRDMVGTMTNTLILAFLGSGFTLIMYLSSLSLSPFQLLTSAYFSTEMISGIASSIGMILAIPLTALITSALLKRSR